MTKIQNEDVLLVNALPGDFDYNKDSKMAGKTYRRFSFNNKVFISNDPTFYAAIAKGDVHTIALETSEEGKLTMTGFITYTRMQGQKRNQVILESITAANYVAQALTSPEESLA
jgi:hypothetical protein